MDTILPIFEYHCHACAMTFEKLIRSAADEQGVICRHCSGSSVDRILSASSFKLQGGGWYQDGYDKRPKVAAKKENPTTKSDTKG